MGKLSREFSNTISTASGQKNANSNSFGVILEDVCGYFGEGLEDIWKYLWRYDWKVFGGYLEVCLKGAWCLGVIYPLCVC